MLIVRIFLGSIITGQMAAVIYSFAGGIPALLFGAVTRKVFGYRLIWVQSAISAVIHNAGQMAAAVLITGTGEIAVYMPVLVISGIVTGVFTGVCAYLVILALEKRGFVNGEGTLN